MPYIPSVRYPIRRQRGIRGRFPRIFRPLPISRRDLLKIPRMRHPAILHKNKRPIVGQSAQEARAVPSSLVFGSLPERILWRTLDNAGIAFDFQSSMQGGRAMLGGMVVDFLLHDRKVAIRVQGTLWHTGLEGEARDMEQAQVLAKLGWTVIDVWDWQIMNRNLFDEWFRHNVQTAWTIPSSTGEPGALSWLPTH